MGIHLHHDRLRLADGVGETDGAAFSKSRRHNVFCDVAGHIGSAAIHLGAVLAGQRAAAMWCEAAVGIHHQLTACESGIRFKAALHKSAGGIDENLRFGIQREVLKSGLDNMAHDRMAKLRQLHTILMLAGDHYGRDTLGNAELILHRHLRLTVRLQARDRAQLSRLGQQAGKFMCQHYRQWKKLRCFIAGIAVHNALVACSGLRAAIDCSGDVGALLMGDHLHLIIAAAISGFPHSAADDGRDVREPCRRDLASRDDLTRGRHDLTGYMGDGIMLQTGIHYGVGNGVAEFVRVALSDRLRG